MERDDLSAFHVEVSRLARTMRSRDRRIEVPPPLCERCLLKRRDRTETDILAESKSDRDQWRLHLAGKLAEGPMLAAVTNKWLFSDLLKRRAEKRNGGQGRPVTRTKRSDSAAGFGDEEAP
jgi:hypothetical protein